MPGRTAKFVSAILAELPRGHPAGNGVARRTPAADDCLSGPKEQTPQGSHWYYRIDHATKRHCWYLADSAKRFRKALRRIPLPSAKPFRRTQKPRRNASITDAHAELPAQSPRTANRNAEIAPRIVGSTPAQRRITANATPADVDTTIAGRFALARAVRDRSLGRSVADRRPIPAASRTIRSQRDSRSAAPCRRPALAAADMSPESQPGSIQTLLARHSRRAGAGGSDGKRDFQVRQPAMDRPEPDSGRSAAIWEIGG